MRARPGVHMQKIPDRAPNRWSAGLPLVPGLALVLRAYLVHVAVSGRVEKLAEAFAPGHQSWRADRLDVPGRGPPDAPFTRGAVEPLDDHLAVVVDAGDQHAAIGPPGRGHAADDLPPEVRVLRRRRRPHFALHSRDGSKLRDISIYRS